MKKILTVFSIAMCMITVFPAAVCADEAEGLFLTDAGQGEELIMDEAVPASEDIGEITAIDAPGKKEYSFEFKCSLADVVEELPQTLTVHSGDDTVSIDVKWICEKDYNDTLGEYPFIPDMTGYTLAEGTVIPKITVTFEEEVADGPKGLNPITIPGREIPFTADADCGLNTLSATALPSAYNLMEEGKLPAIRQQRGGTCWAHATIGAMETDLIHDGKAGTDIDLSEMHLTYYFFNHYEDPKGCRKNDVKHTGSVSFLDNGSTADYAVKILSNLVGAVSEEVVPEETDFDTFNPDQSYVVSKDKVQIRNAYFINTADKNGIKTAVMEHGGVAVAYWDEDEYYNATHASYYCTDGAYVNHAVMIAGWDDGFSKSWFSSTPAGDGAWLIRNSWGGDNDKYSHQGYFWMSYYDKSLTNGSNPAVAIDADTNVFGHCYAYDDFPLPFSSYPIAPSDSVSFVYSVSGHEAVKGIGIELETANVNIKATAKNKSTGQSVTGSLKTGDMGIYTVTFSKPLEVYDRSTVEVTLKLTSDTDELVWMAAESPDVYSYGSYTYNTTIDAGYYLNGIKRTERDLRVKLYTDDSNAVYNKVTGVTLKDKASVNIGSTVTLTATVLPSDATFKSVTWSSSDTAVATVSSKGVVKGKKAGTAKITVTTVDGRKTATCVVTVNPVKVKSVSLKSKATVIKGKTIKLEPVITPANATNKKVTWKSNRKSVATVDKNGKVKGKKAGKAKITVTTDDGKRKATCTVTVKNPVKVKEVKLNKKKVNVKVGKTVKLTARIKPANATNKSVTWKSSKKSVATVDKNGKVKGKKAGKATITVTTKDGKKKATCTVTVK